MRILCFVFGLLFTNGLSYERGLRARSPGIVGILLGGSRGGGFSRLCVFLHPCLQILCLRVRELGRSVFGVGAYPGISGCCS